jgi:hypothetical protein
LFQASQRDQRLFTSEVVINFPVRVDVAEFGSRLQ